MPEWLSTISSVVAGGGLTMLSSWIADRRLTARDRERRSEEERERLQVRRKDFQRDTLLELQIASQKLLRNAGASLHQDIMAHRKTGIWQKQQLPGDLSDGHLRWSTEMMLLSSRVLDEEIRSLADQLRTLTVTVGFSNNEDDAEAGMSAAAEVQQALIRRIGKLVREMDTPGES
jgi:hypothetical protein